jgi:DNA-binding NtrC family response regulator
MKCKKVPGYKQKSLSVEAETVLRNHPWPGNIRELQNTLTRAMVWTDEKILNAEMINEALLTLPNSGQKYNDIMNRSLDQNFDIRALLDQIKGHYFKKAIVLSHGNKKKAADLLGLANYQTLATWLKNQN